MRPADPPTSIAESSDDRALQGAIVPRREVESLSDIRALRIRGLVQNGLSFGRTALIRADLLQAPVLPECHTSPAALPGGEIRTL